MQYKHNHKKKRGQLVTVIIIDKKRYSIRLSDHAKIRLKERKIDLYQAIGSLLSLGEEKIKQYQKTNRDIFIMDKEHNFSIVITFEGNTIHIITLIDNSDCWIKSGTIAVNLK